MELNPGDAVQLSGPAGADWPYKLTVVRVGPEISGKQVIVVAAQASDGSPCGEVEVVLDKTQ